ncbi:MAG: hypothetical protein AB8V19_01920, partial [Candidatus Midichloria sp.]
SLSLTLCIIRKITGVNITKVNLPMMAKENDFILRARKVFNETNLIVIVCISLIYVALTYIYKRLGPVNI